MKLEKKFKVEDGKLLFLDGRELAVCKDRVEAKDCNSRLAAAADSAKLLVINLPWTQVGLDEENYNEEFLAAFRDFLKELEDRSVYAAIVPVADKLPGTGEEEAFVQSFKHCARRIKDCVSVAGFAVPQQADSDYFMAELSQKHEQYVFFSTDKEHLQNSKIVNL